jgi:hypothetical protein
MKKQFFRSLKPQTRFIPDVADYQFNDRISNASFVAAFILLLINALLVWINFTSLPPEIPLFLQRPWGEEQLADKNLIWIQPGLLVIFFLINYAISLVTLKKEPLTARVLGGTILICSLMSLISVWNIMNLVIRVKLWW